MIENCHTVERLPVGWSDVENHSHTSMCAMERSLNRNCLHTVSLTESMIVKTAKKRTQRSDSESRS